MFNKNTTFLIKKFTTKHTKNHEENSHENAQNAQREIRRRLRGFTRILFLPAGADLAAAFSIPVSAKPAADVRWAIKDGPHKNMQAGKKGFFISH